MELIVYPLSFAIGIALGLLILKGIHLLVSPIARSGFKVWAVRATEAWREEHASLDLEWRVFAQRHNAAGKRPMCAYKGMENDPNRKLEMYEFPYGPDSQHDPIDPDHLRKVQWAAAKERDKRSQITGE